MNTLIFILSSCSQANSKTILHMKWIAIDMKLSVSARAPVFGNVSSHFNKWWNFRTLYCRHSATQTHTHTHIRAMNGNGNCVTCAIAKSISQSTSNYLVVVNNKFKLPYSIVVDCEMLRSKGMSEIWRLHRWKCLLVCVCVWGWYVKNIVVGGRFVHLFAHLRGLQRKQLTKNARMAKDYNTSAPSVCMFFFSSIYLTAHALR